MSRNKSVFYVKGDESALVNHSGQFVYEVFVFINYDNILSLANHKLFYSDNPINKITRFFKYSKHIEIFCDLYSAPEKWLLDNGFELYVKPEKKKKDEQESLSVERENTKLVSKASSSRIKEL